MLESSDPNQSGTTSSSVHVRSVVVLRGHELPVDEVRFAPNGAVVVSADDRTVRFWTVHSQTLIRSLEIHAWNLTFSPRGPMLAWVTTGGVVQLRSLEGDLLAELPPQGPPVTALAISPDGTVIATGDKLGQVHLWETASHQLLLSFRATSHGEVASSDATPSPVDILRFGLDGSDAYHLAAMCHDPRGNVHLWRVEHPGPRATWIATAARDLDVWTMSFSPDGRLLAVTDFGNSGVHFLDALTLTRRGGVMVEDETFKGLAFSPDGRRVALAGGAGMMYLWDLTTQRIVARIAAHTDGCDYRTNSELWALGGIDWSSDGRLLVTSGTSPFTLYDPVMQRFTGPDDYTVKLWVVQEVG